MTLDHFVFATVLALVPGLSAITAQKQVSSNPSASSAIHLSVVVTNKAGTPISGLSQQDFTVLDNKQPRPITSFKVVSHAQEPVEVILFLDAVNSPFNVVALERQGVDKFLRSNEGRLAFPTTLAVLTDKGLQMQKGFSTDGNETGDGLEHYSIGLRDVTRDSEWGGLDRLQLSLQALHNLVAYAATLPGRKIVLWVSTGWPLLSGSRNDLDSQQDERIFNEIVSFSTQMRLAKMTLYNLNPIGVGESLSQEYSYLAFLKGVSKPNQVQIGDVGLQVLAVQSGGLAIEGNSNIPETIGRCLADVQSWYEIEFDSPPPDKPNEYHHLEIKVDKPGLTARTRDGYYANPTAAQK